MDKISAALICGIITLMCISGSIIYNTWIAEDGPGNVSENNGRATKEEILIFHDDTSITNNSNRRLWVRVQMDKPTASETTSKSMNEMTADEAADEAVARETAEVISRYIEKGLWQDGGDGWYYYNESIGFAQRTVPLVEEVRYAANSTAEERTGNFEDDGIQGSFTLNGSFRLKVEAVDEAWLLQKPRDGKEAFALFKKAVAVPDSIYL